jgi:hypothetical protein
MCDPGLGLRRQGVALVIAGRRHPGMSDPDVLAWAARDERTLQTFDK